MRVRRCALRCLAARLNAGTYRLLALIAEFDRLEGWKREGFASCVAWLAYRTRLDKMTAREKVRIAKALAVLPKTSEAMARGELSFSQVRAITRAADPESEEELLEHARTLSAAQLEKLVRSWKKLPCEDEALLEARIHESRTLSIFPDDEGAYLIRGRLEPQVAVLLMRAIEAASDALYAGSVPETTPEQRRADALAAMPSLDRAFPPVVAALWYAALGANDEALQRLEQAVEQRADPNVPFALIHPLFQPLRRDARFTALTESIGLRLR